ncbi:MAG: hypothetical protein QOI24_2764 [Acidobacteriota bacterium]|jgi:hypothetical protein|nr:hypothetical protein [Acidobacteriota bacterium]
MDNTQECPEEKSGNPTLSCSDRSCARIAKLVGGRKKN